VLYRPREVGKWGGYHAQISCKLGAISPASSAAARESLQVWGNLNIVNSFSCILRHHDYLNIATEQHSSLLVVYGLSSSFNMPPLPGFSDSPLHTRNDLVAATYSLLTPLLQYQSPKGARIRVPVGTAAHFDETAAQLEGFARPLWAVAALLASHDPTVPVDDRLKGWIDGIAAGTDPSSGIQEYWGEVSDLDQRMVEIEILGYALLAAPHAFLGPPNSTVESDIKRKENIAHFLKSVNGKEFPQNNWLWFRVMANLALVKTCGVPYEELRDSMNDDLKVLDTFYFGDGWASDGDWSVKRDRKQMDYYAGSYAIQFSQCVYVKYAADIDPERVKVFRQRAREFAVEFWRYFDASGRLASLLNYLRVRLTSNRCRHPFWPKSDLPFCDRCFLGSRNRG
jgi:hypothetical protein